MTSGAEKFGAVLHTKEAYGFPLVSLSNLSPTPLERFVKEWEKDLSTKP